VARPIRWLARSLVRAGALFTGALVAGGCLVNPSPEPPSFEPMDVRVGVCMPGASCAAGVIVIEGAPGAAARGSSIWIVNLASNRPPELFPVARDGSFSGEIAGSLLDRYRIQARTGDLRSAPMDMEIIEGGLIGPAGGDAYCATIAPTLELELPDTAVGEAGVGTLSIHNTCGSAVTVSAALRVPNAAFEMSIMPASIDPGSDGVVQVLFRPSATGLTEEILFADFGAAGSAITLLGRGI
jgi:hypothetical protein